MQYIKIGKTDKPKKVLLVDFEACTRKVDRGVEEYSLHPAVKVYLANHKPVRLPFSSADFTFMLHVAAQLNIVANFTDDNFFCLHNDIYHDEPATLEQLLSR